MVNRYYRPKFPIEHSKWFKKRKINMEELADKPLTDAEVCRLLYRSDARIKLNTKLAQALANKKTI